ncbi:hypothetical protein Golob_023867, partial [Gossypium lobatum]|nr:hypothetical protein [Gossypium lobatum]
VSNCSAGISFPEEGFPTNLTSLQISKAPRIYTSLVEWGLNRLTSLQELEISGEGCSSVNSFPEEGIGMTLPPSLTSICIRDFENLEFIGCPLLDERCSRGKGREWSKIAHIPYVRLITNVMPRELD